MFGDSEVLQAEGLRGFRHFFERVVPVARHRVAMKRAAQIFVLNSLRQRMFFGGLEFAAVLTQLRRNEIEVERAV